MDLYNPLYVPRPVVEPELFASLRPVTYRGAFDKQQGQFMIGGSVNSPPSPSTGPPGAVAVMGIPPGGGGALGVQPLTGSGAAPAQGITNGSTAGTEFRFAPPTNQATEEQRRLYAANLGRDLGKRIDTGTVGNAAIAAALGDFFQYTIDHPVTLARQKSAMLPIVGKEVEGQKVSIYNQAVQKTHSLLGLKFKNTSGAHLNQGPVTVFEGSVYAGDTRVLDVQPNEERLVSYAIDLGTEVDPQVGPGTQKITSVKAVKGVVTTVTKVIEGH